MRLCSWCALPVVVFSTIESSWVDVEEDSTDESTEFIEDGWLMVNSGYINFSLPLIGTSERMRLWKSAIPPPGKTFEESFNEHFDRLSDHTKASIMVDIKRSGVGMSYSGKYDWLEDVLKAYAVRNEQVRYCQGMNYIAAKFIEMGFSKKDAFFGLAFLLERVAVGYHTEDFHGFANDTAIVGKVIEKSFPATAAKIAAINIEGDDIVHMITVDTSLSLFARSLPPHAILPIWDILMVHGRRGLLAATTGMIVFVGDCFPSEFNYEAVPKAIRCYSDGLSTISIDKLPVLLGLIDLVLDSPQVREINPFAR